jgi:nucleoside-diphosphate-sugar epimerase
MTDVLVLGANGFVGSRLIGALARSDWARPIAAVRPATAAQAHRLGVEVRACDGTDPAALARALSGIGVVVNCVAGDGHTIVAGAEALFAAAKGAGVERVVHLSSMAVYGSATGPVAETAALLDDIDWYGRAKIAAERLAMAFVGAGGQAVILRPGCIYGPGSRPWTERIGRWLRSGRLGDLGAAGDGFSNLIFIDDVVAAIIQSLRRPDLSGEAFNLADPDPETWNGYFTRLGRAIGAVPIRRISARRLKLETKLLAPPLKIIEILCGRAGLSTRSLPEPIPPSLARLWRQEIRLDHRKADARLRFERTPLAVGIAASARWLGAQGGSPQSPRVSTSADGTA